MLSAIESLIEKHPEFDSADLRKQMEAFYSLLLEENKIQNLTRLSTPEEFYYGHLCDVLELLHLNWVQFPALDMGSGGGVPGLLGALIQSDPWVLAESEKSKANFLAKTVEQLELASRVTVFSGRAEDYLKGHSVQSVVARAVGPVERIYSWIRKCSTWNNLVLLKGPNWDKEWTEFQQGKWKRELTVESEHFYTVGPEQKSRRIVMLKR